VTTVFVAGATGAIGTVLVPHLRTSGFTVIPHVRPKTAARHPFGKDPEALIADLSDSAKLDARMSGAQSIVCLVGTMRRRFAAGDTYESSDYLPVVQLAESARRVASAEPRHFVLLTALGARAGSGYLGWKFKAEEVVRQSGLPHTVLRPSFLDTTDTGTLPSDGTQRKPPPLVGGALRLLGAFPPLRGLSDDLRPLPAHVLCAAIARILRDRGPLGTLYGRQLWAVGAVTPEAAAPARR
jgi:uncharacterized protein YbjT (DUF2867 family)